MEWLDRVFAYIYWGSISAVVYNASLGKGKSTIHNGCFVHQ